MGHPAGYGDRDPAKPHLRDAQPQAGRLQGQDLIVGAQDGGPGQGMRPAHVRSLLVHGRDEDNVAGWLDLVCCQPAEQVQPWPTGTVSMWASRTSRGAVPDPGTVATMFERPAVTGWRAGWSPRSESLLPTHSAQAPSSGPGFWLSIPISVLVSRMALSAEIMRVPRARPARPRPPPAR